MAVCFLIKLGPYREYCAHRESCMCYWPSAKLDTVVLCGVLTPQ